MQTPITDDTLAFLYNTQAAGADDDELPELSKTAWEYSYAAVQRDATAEYDEGVRTDDEEKDYIAFLDSMCRDEINHMANHPHPFQDTTTRHLTRKRHRVLAAIFEFRAFPYGSPIVEDTSVYKTY